MYYTCITRPSSKCLNRIKQTMELFQETTVFEKHDGAILRDQGISKGRRNHFDNFCMRDFNMAFVKCLVVRNRSPFIDFLQFRIWILISIQITDYETAPQITHSLICIVWKTAVLMFNLVVIDLIFTCFFFKKITTKIL